MKTKLPPEELKRRLLLRINKVPSSGCWQWTAGLSGMGYASLFDGIKTAKAHRISYEVFKGEVPSDKLVMHLCSNKACVNPEHLKLGTNSENLRQFFTENGRVQRRHFRDPRKHSHAKLTWEKVVKIRNQYAAGFHSAAELARNFGVSSNTIRAIAQNRIWKWKDKESWVNSQKHQI